LGFRQLVSYKYEEEEEEEEEDDDYDTDDDEENDDENFCLHSHKPTDCGTTSPFVGLLSEVPSQ